MTELAIRVRGLGKRYRIRHQRAERYTTLRDVLTTSVRRLWARNDASDALNTVEEFWALRDVSFDIEPGEIVGLIGRNGAGKSTLLKILSRITEPSRGRVELRGRVGSLLEVGTGFHPELTGRENIFLNGGILGMSRAEVRKKFDEIVAFAEIDKFLDTPIKRYSSGMYVRLAFAVAAHLHSDILIVDEVLAVGDEQFQKKCLDKMDDVSKGGRTVILVSHDMRKVTSLCERGILLDAGAVEADGKMTDIIDTYLGRHKPSTAFVDLSVRSDRSGSGVAHLQSIELHSPEGVGTTFAFGDSFTQRIRVEVREPFGAGLVGSVIRTSEGVAVCELLNSIDNFPWNTEIGHHTFEVAFDKLVLYPGRYSIDLWLGTSTFSRVDYLVEAITFDVVQTSNSGLYYTLDKANGLFRYPASWSQSIG
jgi:lipopolysaccharide transport system ATP-binding protein